MKTLRIFFACLFSLLALPALAQTVGPIAITSGQCASIGVSPSAAVVGIEVVGTWTGTLQPKGTIQGQSAFNVLVTPSTSASSQSTITANGGYFALVAGYTTFQVCGATVATGTANVYLNLSQATAGSGAGAAPASAFSIVASGLLADYQMPPTESSTTVLTDYSGNGNNGTFPGGGANPTRISATGGLSFVGSSSQLITLPAALNSCKSFFFAYSFNASQNFSGTNFSSLIQQQPATANNVVQLGFVQASTAGAPYGQTAKLKALYAFIGNVGAPGSTVIGATGQGTHIIAFVGDTLDHIYLDGQEPTIYTVQVANVYNPGASVYQLGGGSFNTQFFTGNIYRFACYNRALSAAEVAQNSVAMTLTLQQQGVKIPVNGATGTTATVDNVVLDGDSIASGFAENSAGIIAWNQNLVLSPTANLFVSGLPGQNLSVPGTQAGSPNGYLLTNLQNPLSLYSFSSARNLLIEEGGVNDLRSPFNATTAQVAGAMESVCRQAATMGFLCMPTSQMAGAGAAPKNSYNAYLRQHWNEFARAFVDLGSDANLGCDACASNTAYFLDLLHPTVYGNTFLQYYIQRAINRLYGAQDLSDATTYSSAAAAANTVTAASDSGSVGGGSLSSIATYTFAANVFPVGALVTCTGLTPAGYNTSLVVKTSTGTQITGTIGTASLGAGTVFGSCTSPQIEDKVFVLNFGAGNATLGTACGYTGQRLTVKNVNAAGSTLVPFGTETIDGAANLAIATNQTRILEAIVTTPATPVCGWKVIQ